MFPSGTCPDPGAIEKTSSLEGFPACGHWMGGSHGSAEAKLAETRDANIVAKPRQIT